MSTTPNNVTYTEAIDDNIAVTRCTINAIEVESEESKSKLLAVAEKYWQQMH